MFPAQATVRKRASVSPKFFVGVACASPHRDEDPGCVGGEARQENLPQRHATAIKRDDVEGDRLVTLVATP